MIDIINIYIYIWRFHIKRCRPLSAGVFFLVLAGCGGFGRGGDKTGLWGPDGCGAGFTAPPFFTPTRSKHIWSRARPFEAGGGRMGDSKRVCGVGKARATTHHSSYSYYQKRDGVALRMVTSLSEGVGISAGPLCAGRGAV